MTPVKIGIIGGSGLNNPNLFEVTSESPQDTPYGPPSDILREGFIEGVPCVLLARHGRKHTIMPTKVNYRANLWALKARGCTHILVSTACGSLQENICPGDFVILDQFIDRTTKRSQTFYDGEEGHPAGILHLPMDTPFCSDTATILKRCCDDMGYTVHPTGTVVTIEGPRFSSKAESRMFRQWGADVINMTTVPEVVLARELGMCYAAIAMATDYDSWREGHEAVTVEAVMATFRTNAEKAVNVLKLAVAIIAGEDWSQRISTLKCRRACHAAPITRKVLNTLYFMQHRNILTE
ncbi:S-methyl-5'-thioadenosine phosphorylase-like isoform X1 [Portunus trituberculatus]|uniref:S-methyl-5'-thioadenosine phosphorylase-like isoform X1 n=2 Tax=Portunus trituberculatus TaxID=210409 RepID=UPI001E1D0BFA|nr:S-methyl-5'-thioadenosine phosphorylase-like isoform X1 [Portunus trituberculatus]